MLSLALLGAACHDDPQHPLEGLEDPAFTYVPSNWFNQPNVLRMDDFWQADGIQATGKNYYFLPQSAAGALYSQRFAPLSDYFQAWFGAYTVDDTNGTVYALSADGVDARAIVALAIADQKAWLGSLGLSQPLVTLDTSVPLTVSEMQLDGHPGWRIAGWINANVDVGNDNPQSDLPALLMPPLSAWQGLVESYGPARLEVVSYVWHSPENNELTVVYYNGIEFDDLTHAHHRTLPSISGELELMAMGVTTHK